MYLAYSFSIEEVLGKVRYGTLVKRLQAGHLTTMATKVRHTVQLPVSAERYWSVRNTPEFLAVENEILHSDRFVW